MNSLNSNNEPVFGKKSTWGKIALVYMVVVALAIMSKGCNDTNDGTPMFISKGK